MTDSRIAKLLAIGPARRFIEHTGRRPTFRKIYERFSGAARFHVSMDAARDAIRRHRPETRGHFEHELIDSNFLLSGRIRMSDYPVLYWMRDIAAQEKLRIFDFGGGVGQTYLNYSQRLSADKLLSWIVQDLPEVVVRTDGKYLPDEDPAKLSFTTRLSDASGSNLFLAAGALHYWERPIADLLEELGSRPEHFIVNRSPMTTSQPPFCTVQEGGYWAVACMVRNLEELTAEMKAEGYSLIDTWVDLEKSLTFPWLPAFSCSYHGAYFRRDRRLTT